MVAYPFVPDVSIADPADRRVAEYRDLGDGELMRARGLFVAEGRIVVRRLLEDQRFAVRSVLVSPAARHALDAVLSSREVVGRRPSVYVAPAGAFESIAGFAFHRGCLALAERPKEPAVEPLVERASLVVVLEGVTNADNVGGVFRNAAAFGADAVLLSQTCCDPLYRKAIRTSMGAVLRVPFARLSDWPAALDDLHRRGFTSVALTPRQPSMPIDEFVAGTRPDRLALVVGTEGPGLSGAVEAAAHYRVSIPMRSEVDSLNLAVATGIALARIVGPGASEC
jgi:tRNA G18 (ribose-2'-O)-methylase SpoU